MGGRKGDESFTTKPTFSTKQGSTQLTPQVPNTELNIKNSIQIKKLNFMGRSHISGSLAPTSDAHRFGPSGTGSFNVPQSSTNFQPV